MSHKSRDVKLGIPVVKSDLPRFWAKVRIAGPDECWPWMASTSGSKNHQYGQFTLNDAGRQRHVGAHIFAFESEHGWGSADGFEVCHSCDAPECCNPRHLFRGDHFANMQDASAKGRLLS